MSSKELNPHGFEIENSGPWRFNTVCTDKRDIVALSIGIRGAWNASCGHLTLLRVAPAA
jgi:hypothetical protein